MKHLQQVQQIIALAMQVNAISTVEMVVDYGKTGAEQISVYAYRRQPGQSFVEVGRCYHSGAVYFDWPEAAEQLATIISDLQAMLTQQEAAA